MWNNILMILKKQGLNRTQHIRSIQKMLMQKLELKQMKQTSKVWEHPNKGEK